MGLSAHDPYAVWVITSTIINKRYNRSHLYYLPGTVLALEITIPANVFEQYCVPSSVIYIFT